MKIARFASFSLLVSLACFARGAGVPFFAQHSLGIERPDEIIEVPCSEILKSLKGVEEGRWQFRDAKGQVLPFQILRLAKGNRVLLQHSFDKRDFTANFTLVADPSATIPPAKPPVQLPSGNARDLVVEARTAAFRLHEAGGGSPGGVDIYLKRVPHLIPGLLRFDIQKGFIPAEKAGVVADLGPGPGCGGTGLWFENKFVQGEGFRSVRVLYSGPIRTLVEVMMATVEAGGVQVDETRILTLDAGSPLVTVESRYRISGGAEATIAIGLSVPKSEDENLQPVVHRADGKGRVLVWSPVKAAPAAFGIEMVDTEKCSLAPVGEAVFVLRHIRNGSVVRYVVGASESGLAQAETADKWEKHWEGLLQRRQNLVQVSFRAFAPPPDF